VPHHYLKAQAGLPLQSDLRAAQPVLGQSRSFQTDVQCRHTDRCACLAHKLFRGLWALFEPKNACAEQLLPCRSDENPCELSDVTSERIGLWVVCCHRGGVSYTSGLRPYVRHSETLSYDLETQNACGIRIGCKRHGDIAYFTVRRRPPLTNAVGLSR
jgi:hypothetical protein